MGKKVSSLEGFKMTVVAAYVRVSTRHQKHDGQRAELQKWLDGNGIDPEKVEWYADKESGTTMKRPEFDRLQADRPTGKKYPKSELESVEIIPVDQHSPEHPTGASSCTGPGPP